MEISATKKSVPDWRLGLSYFGFLLIGIIPINVVTSILSAFGNDTYKFVLVVIYILVLPFLIKKLVITATTLLKNRYHVPSNTFLVYTFTYFIVIWLFLTRPSLENPQAFIPILFEAYLLGWLLWYSLKFLKN